MARKLQSARLTVFVVLALALAGCAHRTPAPAALPAATSARQEPSIPPPPALRLVTIIWSNPPTPLAPSLWTGLEQCTNLYPPKHWTLIFSNEYRVEGIARLTNPPPAAFWRVFNQPKAQTDDDLR